MLMGSIRSFTPSVTISVSPSWMVSSNVNPYWNPEQPALDVDPQHQPWITLFGDQLRHLRRGRVRKQQG